ncbi:glycosyltransferase [Sporolactobacillus sp. CPB3-1]|uniref:Glycosyltransferase n=1 Tax=Sporolactobacillus mangiferae TaxID=2940498 RepID=A0ABT0MC99_9BACL|nr:glycosyltransferase [Sporolactobacillus mangiferae]MCL1632497.1 glycosyltransferase [Sporolactobacillus mangiferae]
MPEYKMQMTHLERMTDDTGLIEHALGNIPRRSEGYTTDDNARALWLVSEWQQIDDRDSVIRRLRRLSDIYLSFLQYAQQPDGHFHNNYAYDRTPEEELPSDDCLGRSLWALGCACLNLPHRDSRFAAALLFQKAFGAAPKMTFPRGIAYALATASHMLNRSNDLTELPEFCDFIRREAPELIEESEARLLSLFETNSEKGWQWFEPMMTYGNGVLPWALFRSFQVTGNSDALLIAGESLDFLIDKMTSERGNIRPIGNHGWCTAARCSQWAQQPVEVMALALASEQAIQLLNRPEKYLAVLEKCRSWFYGGNDLHECMADAEEGGCRDGLEAGGASRNQGAESTLSYLMTELIYRRVINTNTSGRTAFFANQEF